MTATVPDAFLHAMPDQANSLRQLVLTNSAARSPGGRLRPSVALIAGGKGGVGTTTMALNLAVALSQRGIRTVLIDADPRGGDVATLCRLDDSLTLADVLAGRCTVAESLQPGPGGIHVLAGVWALERVSDYPPAACDSVFGQLAGLTDVADWVLVDAGHASASTALRMWHSADLMLLVTTAEDAAVMDTYAAIKTLVTRKQPATLATLVNAVSRPAEGSEVHDRLARACRRFLGFEPVSAGCVESDPLVQRAAAMGDPFVLMMPTGTVARQVSRAAKNLFGLPAMRRLAG
ncbi:MAG: P-loop NTPase [Thermoguttaceae bacterium]|nr:P-loop NTPase [Thermoguttaceae bacterium]